MILRSSLALLTAMAYAIPAPGESDAKLKVLIVTGGHGFKREPFFRMFEDNPEITFTEARQGRDSSTAYERDDLLTHDVVVLYDMVQEMTDQQKARFLSLFDHGVGLVVLHHALVSYQGWPEYERIIGGRYPENPARPGLVTDEVGYEHDVDIPVVVLDGTHPITRGLSDFVVHDEVYWGFRVGHDVTPLLTTTHPRSGNPLAWTRTEKRSRVAFIKLGHGPRAFEDDNYRRLLAQSIRWSANKPDQADARSADSSRGGRLDR